MFISKYDRIIQQDKEGCIGLMRYVVNYTMMKLIFYIYIYMTVVVSIDIHNLF
jgi:hypothetical protein